MQSLHKNRGNRSARFTSRSQANINRPLGLPRRLTILMALVLASLATAVTTAGTLRVWTSADGKFSTIAEFISTNGVTVELERHDGRVVRVPVAKLSKSDREFIHQQQTGSVAEGERPDVAGMSSRQLERQARESDTASEALLLYQFFLARTDLPAIERTHAEQRIKHWQNLALKGAIRMGKDWVTREEAEAAKEKAEEKIEMAIEFLRIRNGELAEQALREASKLDPASLKADFLMGVVYGLYMDNDYKAARHFEECVERDPGSVSARNNLAISLCLMGKFNDSVEHFEMAVSLSPQAPQLAHNIASLIGLADSPIVNISKRKLQVMSDLYATILKENRHSKPNPTNYLYYMPPSGVDFGRGIGNSAPESRSVVVGSGTGWVIQPNMIVTNEHVVEDSDGLLVLDPKDPNKRLAASVVAVDKTRDLALVRCTELDAPPLRISRTLPRRGSDVMVLGYPLGPAMGNNLKATRGAMVAMPDAANDGLCLYDALTNPGNSGGPLCDKSGRVVGVVRAIMGDKGGGAYGAAIPLSTAALFLDQHLSSLYYEDSVGSPMSWPDVDQEVSPSTVLILIKENIRTDLDWSRKR